MLTYADLKTLDTLVFSFDNSDLEISVLRADGVDLFLYTKILGNKIIRKGHAKYISDVLIHNYGSRHLGKINHVKLDLSDLKAGVFLHRREHYTELPLFNMWEERIVV